MPCHFISHSIYGKSDFHLVGYSVKYKYGSVTVMFSTWWICDAVLEGTIGQFALVKLEGFPLRKLYQGSVHTYDKTPHFLMALDRTQQINQVFKNNELVTKARDKVMLKCKQNESKDFGNTHYMLFLRKGLSPLTYYKNQWF